MSLFFDKLYTYTELGSINLPLKKAELPSILHQLDGLYKIIQIYHQKCNQLDDEYSMMRAKTFLQPFMYDRKRL
jgi:hypothetical protein